MRPVPRLVGARCSPIPSGGELIAGSCPACSSGWSWRHAVVFGSPARRLDLEARTPTIVGLRNGLRRRRFAGLSGRCKRDQRGDLELPARARPRSADAPHRARWISLSLATSRPRTRGAQGPSMAPRTAGRLCCGDADESSSRHARRPLMAHTVRELRQQHRVLHPQASDDRVPSSR